MPIDIQGHPWLTTLLAALIAAILALTAHHVVRAVLRRIVRRVRRCAPMRARSSAPRNGLPT